jgi:hypothetical protein
MDRIILKGPYRYVRILKECFWFREESNVGYCDSDCINGGEFLDSVSDN